MNSHPTPISHLNGSTRRRRFTRPLGPSTAVPDERTAAAMDDAAEARALIDDLIALIDAGLVVPIEDGSEIRYGLAEPDDLSA
jgi:hypothetical protein